MIACGLKNLPNEFLGDTNFIAPRFKRDVWMLSDYLNVKIILKYDGKNKIYLLFDVRYT